MAIARQGWDRIPVLGSDPSSMNPLRSDSGAYTVKMTATVPFWQKTHPFIQLFEIPNGHAKAGRFFWTLKVMMAIGGPYRVFEPLKRMPFMTRKLTFLAAALATLLAVTGCASKGTGPKTVDGMSPVATLEMHQVQAAYIASASGGDGTLFYNGQSYPFHVGGVGIGGIGASTLQATGEVYGMSQLSQFTGAYAQGRYGFALGNISGGDLWLKNNSGVILHLKAKRTGLMLSLGGDAVVITFK